MRLEEVIKLGKPFKRIDDVKWAEVDLDGDIVHADDPYKPEYVFHSEDITATDWVVREDTTLLYRRPVAPCVGAWKTGTIWYTSKLEFMKNYTYAVAYGDWETMENPMNKEEK